MLTVGAHHTPERETVWKRKRLRKPGIEDIVELCSYTFMNQIFPTGLKNYNSLQKVINTSEKNTNKTPPSSTFSELISTNVMLWMASA
jgi:hypothetical protein